MLLMLFLFSFGAVLLIFVSWKRIVNATLFALKMFITEWIAAH